MDPVSNVDTLVLLLRQRLAERSRTTASRTAAAARPARPAAADPLATLQALAAVEGLDERKLARGLIQSLLAEHFGAHLINQPEFQQVVDRVTDTLQGDAQGSELLSRLTRDLRAAARR